jgi:hypothetical protein
VIEDQNTLFPILILDDGDGFDRLIELASPFLDRSGLDRLGRALGGSCRSIVIERHYIDRDYRDTFSHFHSKRFATPMARCVRLHFFSCEVSTREIIEEETTVKDGYLGYSVLRPVKPNCVGRTLISTKTHSNSDFHLCVCQESVSLLGSDFSVEGFPFISQDGDATVCAQSALWMTFRYFSNRYSTYAEILPFAVTDLASQHATGTRIYPSAGLYSWQLAEALRLQGLSPVTYSRTAHGEEFDHLLYTYIESGIPVLATVPEHVVVTYGHYSDFSNPLSEEPDKLLRSSSWNSELMISDDNCQPYQRMVKASPPPVDASRYTWSDVQEFIVPLPERVFLAAEQVEPIIDRILGTQKFGLETNSERLQRLLQNGRLMTRLFLTSCKSFKRKLRERGMGHSTVESIYRNIPLPHFIWVCELADAEEYRESKRVLGEIIWDATRNAYEPSGWLALHYPERLIVDRGSCLDTVIGDSIEVELGSHESYPLYRSNLTTIA